MSTQPEWANALKKKQISPEKPTSQEQETSVPAWANALKKKESTPPTEDTSSPSPWGVTLKSSKSTAEPAKEGILQKGIIETTPVSVKDTLESREDSVDMGFRLPSKVEDRDNNPSISVTKNAKSTFFTHDVLSPPTSGTVSWENTPVKEEMKKSGSSSKNISRSSSSKEKKVVYDKEESSGKMERSSSSKKMSKSSSIKHSSSHKDKNVDHDVIDSICNLIDKVDGLESILNDLIKKLDQIATK